MTSINAMRFDHYSGVLVSDEARAWNPEFMAFFTPEKIRSVIRPDIQKELGIVVCQGNTGTSSLGDEFIEEVKGRIGEEYDKETKKTGKKLATFKKMDELAHLAYEVIIGLKHHHINEGLSGKFGFTTADYIAGSYKKGDKTIEIKEKDVIDTVYKYITWEGRMEEVQPVFLNAQVFAGYEPESGFKIYFLSEIIPVCEAVQEIFLAEGSGLDTCDNIYSNYASTRSIPERRGAIDRVEGLVVMIEGLNTAHRLGAGVGGYLKIIYINGREKDNMALMKEIADWRAKMASEVVQAGACGFVPRDRVMQLVEAIIYKDRPFGEMNERFLQSSTDQKKMTRLFRGYTI